MSETIVIPPRSATLVGVPSRGPQGIPGKGLIVLDAEEPVPADTPSGTVIFRRDP